MEPGFEEALSPFFWKLPVFHTGQRASGYCHSGLPRDYSCPEIVWLTLILDLCIALKLFSFSTLQQPSAFEESSPGNVCFSLTCLSLLEPTEKQKVKEERGPCSISLIKLPASGLCPALGNSPQLTQKKPCDLSKSHWLIYSGLLQFSGCANALLDMFKNIYATLKDMDY